MMDVSITMLLNQGDSASQRQRVQGAIWICTRLQLQVFVLSAVDD